MADKNIGKITQVIGAVLDLKFSEGYLPEINDAVEITRKDGGKLVVEVAQHLGDDIVRCIAMGPTDGLVRGMDAVATGGPISVPVGEATLGRIFNVLQDTNVPIIKGSNGIIAIAADHTEEKECIKCGRCVDVCPMELQPLEIYKLGQLGDAEGLLKLNVMDCFSCKCCEYICSSKIPLVSKINAAKGLVMPLLKKK